MPKQLLSRASSGTGSIPARTSITDQSAQDLASDSSAAEKALLRERKQRNKLGETVRKSVNRYIKDLNGEEPNRLYELVLGEVEKPLLLVVMKHADGNQSRAARMLGINRNTLRKKLEQYGINADR